jgi:hypothetical protein
MGCLPATASAMASVDSVVTTRRSCQERVIAGVPAGVPRPPKMAFGCGAV